MTNNEALKNLTTSRQSNITEQHDLRARLTALEKDLPKIEGAMDALTQLEQANKQAAADAADPALPAGSTYLNAAETSQPI